MARAERKLERLLGGGAFFDGPGAARAGKTDTALYVTTVDVPHGGRP